MLNLKNIIKNYLTNINTEDSVIPLSLKWIDDSSIEDNTKYYISHNDNKIELTHDEMMIIWDAIENVAEKNDIDYRTWDISTKYNNGSETIYYIPTINKNDIIDLIIKELDNDKIGQQILASENI